MTLKTKNNSIDLQRAFIHEMGHFVAAELNFNLFNYDRRIGEFKLHLRQDSSQFYGGFVRTNNVVKSDRFNHKEVAYYVGNIVYGCLFESLYRGIDLNQCLCEISPEKNLQTNIGNGQSDYSEIFFRLRIIEVKLKNVIDDWENYIFDDYFKELNKLKIEKHFDCIFSLDVNDFILHQNLDRKYSIDIKKVKIAVNDFLLLHKPIFKSFLKKLHKIQNSIK